MALVTLGTVEHKAKAAQVSLATPWRLSRESSESQELPLRLPMQVDAIAIRSPRPMGTGKNKHMMGKDGVGATGDH